MVEGLHFSGNPLGGTRVGVSVKQPFITGKMRDEYLSEHWFISLWEARETIEARRNEHNEVRQSPLFDFRSNTYPNNFRYPAPTTPTRPVPRRRSRLLGSGTVLVPRSD
jgi:hypothetical protein